MVSCKSLIHKKINILCHQNLSSGYITDTDFVSLQHCTILDLYVINNLTFSIKKEINEVILF